MATRSPPSPPTEWGVFLENYAKGQWTTVPEKTLGTGPTTPTSESILTPCNEKYNPFSGWNGNLDQDAELPLEEYERRLYPSVEITNETADAVRRYVKRCGFLPPPRSPLEERRLECIEQYDLNTPDQLANIQRVVDVIGAFFPQAIVTYTQFEGKTPMYLASGGNKELIEKFGITTFVPVSPYTAICGHTVLLKDDLMFIPDLRGDFRFRENPATQAGARSYVGSPIFLPLDPLPGDDTVEAEAVGIAALNVLFVDEVHSQLSASEATVIKQVARLLESQIRNTWDGAARSQEAKKRAIVADMVETIFVEEQRLRQAEGANPTADAIRLLKNRETAFVTVATTAVHRLAAALSNLSGITLFEIRIESDIQVSGQQKPLT